MKGIFFILNPASRSGKSGKLFEMLDRFVETENCGGVGVTEAPGHAEQLAREAVEQGYRALVSVGGDGTLNEVVNGIMALPAAERPAVGIYSSGTGGDFFRGLSERHVFPSGLDWLRQRREIPADVGLATFEYGTGKALQKKYFLNIADAGISGEVVRRVNASGKKYGAVEYLIATVASALQYKAPKVRLRWRDLMGSESAREMRLLLAVAANGPYFGGGMCIAPQALIDDGVFELMMAEKISYWTLLTRLPRVYFKQQLRHPKVSYARGAWFCIESLDGDMPLDLDGENLRARKVTFELLPRALRVMVPKC